MKVQPGNVFSMVVKEVEPEVSLVEIVLRAKKVIDIVSVADKIAIIRSDLRPSDLQNTTARFFKQSGLAEEVQQHEPVPRVSPMLLVTSPPMTWNTTRF